MASNPQLTIYTHDFFEDHVDGSRRSAEVIVPLVLRLVPARSVVDVGCGRGVWLTVFQQHGVYDVLGLDGAYVDPATLAMPAERFTPCDLTQPVRIDRRFDLAMSLEVAEHLPPPVAETFVASLTRLAPVILFSAAAPLQGGTGHLNEQWPDYWARRFEVHDYVAVDAIRTHVWHDPRVEWWYAQNTLVLVQRAALGRLPALQRAFEQRRGQPLNVVHPGMYTTHHVANAPLGRVLARLPAAARRALVRRLGLAVAAPRRAVRLGH